jgi:hypothetical protein
MACSGTGLYGQLKNLHLHMIEVSFINAFFDRRGKICLAKIGDWAFSV